MPLRVIQHYSDNYFDKQIDAVKITSLHKYSCRIKNVTNYCCDPSVLLIGAQSGDVLILFLMKLFSKKLIFLVRIPRPNLKIQYKLLLREV